MAICLGCRLLAVPRTSPSGPRGAGVGASMELAGGSQVRFGMCWGSRCFAPDPSIFPALYLFGHTAE